MRTGSGHGPREVLEWPYTAGGGGGAPPIDPPPQDQDHRETKQNLPLGKSGRAIFGTQTFGSQTPPPPEEGQRVVRGADGGKGSKGTAANGDRPVGAGSCRREQHTKGIMPNPQPPFSCNTSLTHPRTATQGVLTDVKELGVMEPFAVKVQTLKTSIEACCMLLRIDDVVSGISAKKEGGGGGPSMTPMDQDAAEEGG